MSVFFMNFDMAQSMIWARDLYDQMQIRSDFRKWFPRMCQYGFVAVSYTHLDVYKRQAFIPFNTLEEAEQFQKEHNVAFCKCGNCFPKEGKK